MVQYCKLECLYFHLMLLEISLLLTMWAKNDAIQVAGKLGTQREADSTGMSSNKESKQSEVKNLIYL